MSTWDEASGKFDVAYSGQQMTITLTEAGLAEINGSDSVYDSDSLNHGYSGCTLRISYSCTLNSDAGLICGDSGNINTVTLTWSRTSSEYIGTLKSDAHVYSYGIDMTKTFSDGAGSFENVKFILRNDTDGCYISAKQIDGIYYAAGNTAEKEQATQFTPTKEGKVYICGLEDDEYTVTEIATDEKYNLLKSGIKVLISTAEGEACPNCHRATLIASATVNGKDAEMKEVDSSAHAAVPFTVVNTKGFELPKTGSYGTWIFAVGGSAAIAVAAFLFYRLCKKKSY